MCFPKLSSLDSLFAVDTVIRPFNYISVTESSPLLKSLLKLNLRDITGLPPLLCFIVLKLSAF